MLREQVGCFENYGVLVTELLTREELLFDPNAVGICAGYGITRLGGWFQKDRYAGRGLVVPHRRTRHPKTTVRRCLRCS